MKTEATAPMTGTAVEAACPEITAAALRRYRLWLLLFTPNVFLTAKKPLPAAKERNV